MKRFLIISITIFLLNGCSDKKIAKSMNSWIGSTKQNLVMQLGPPTQTATDGGKGEVYIYAKRVYSVTPLLNGASHTTDYWVYRMFYINPDDIVYHWLYRKNNNPPERVDINLFIK